MGGGGDGRAVGDRREDGPGLLRGGGPLEGLGLLSGEGAAPAGRQAQLLGGGVRQVPGQGVGQVAPTAQGGGDHRLAAPRVPARHHPLEGRPLPRVDGAGEAGSPVALELGGPGDVGALRGGLLGGEAIVAAQLLRPTRSWCRAPS